MTQPLWPDERIEESLLWFADEKGQVSGDDILPLLYKIRDDMQIKIGELEEECNRIVNKLIDVTSSSVNLANEQQQQIRELKDKKLDTWR